VFHPNSRPTAAWKEPAAMRTDSPAPPSSSVRARPEAVRWTISTRSMAWGARRPEWVSAASSFAGSALHCHGRDPARRQYGSAWLRR
jgi:hypothetical protein